MIKFFKHPFWNFAGVIVAVATAILGILIPYNIYYQSLQQKFLEIRLFSAYDAFNFPVGTIEGLVATYEDKPIHRLTTVIVTIENTGPQEIRLEDYVSPLRFVFPKGAIISDVKILESQPQDLSRILIIIDNTFTLDMDLFNPGDRLTLQFTILDSPTAIDISTMYVEGRIAGVREIKLVDIAERMPSPTITNLLNVAYSPYLVLGIILVFIGWLIILDRRLTRSYGFDEKNAPKVWVWALPIGIWLGVLLKMAYEYAFSAWYAISFPYGPFG